MMSWQPVRKWRLRGSEYVPIVLDADGDEIEAVWAPQAGSQVAFLNSPEIEVLYEGTRGPGKTDALIMDFCQHVGIGYGSEWRGILFRHTFPELKDVIEKSKKWIKRIWPDAFYNEIKFFWEWPTGERLYFAVFDTPSDYTKYHGHSYTWIGWEELTLWKDDKCYKTMFATLRSTVKGIPLKVRSTCNPSGVGHNWVKIRWRLPLAPGLIYGPVIDDARDIETGNLERPRRSIRGHIDENKLLLHVQPDYKKNIAEAARNPGEREAWLNGSWDIVAGGMFDDIWHTHRGVIIVPPFAVPPGWIIRRSYDHGSSKPFCVLWDAESDGTDLVMPDGSVRATVRGDIFLIKEWYGWRGIVNEGLQMLIPEIARGILEREIEWGWRSADGKTIRAKRGPADTSIFDNNNGICVADDFEKPVVVKGTRHRGIYWERADKGPGSREQGWEQLRKRLKSTMRPPGGIRETPGLFVSSECTHWLRTVPTLPRDEKKIDDVNSDAEDHAGDATRYRLRYETRTLKTGRTLV